MMYSISADNKIVDQTAKQSPSSIANVTVTQQYIDQTELFKDARCSEVSGTEPKKERAADNSLCLLIEDLKRNRAESKEVGVAAKPVTMIEDTDVQETDEL